MSGLGSRILVAGGIGLMAVGGGGAIWMAPPGQLEGAAQWLEDQRTALRSHLPETPALQEAILGSDASEAEAGEGNTDFSNQPVRMLRGGGGRTVLAAPMAVEPCAGSDGSDGSAGDCGTGADGQPAFTAGPTLLKRPGQTSSRFRAPATLGEAAPGG